MVYVSPASRVKSLPRVADVDDTKGHAQTAAALETLAGYSPDPVDTEEGLTDDPQSQPPKNRKKRRRQRLGRLQETTAIGLALAGLFVGYVAWRLSVGSISIALAAPLIEDQLSKRFGGEASIGDLRLEWERETASLRVIATEIRAQIPQRQSPLTLGQVNLTLDAAALLGGQAQIKRASLTGAQAVLVIDRDGRTAFGFGPVEEVLAQARQKAAVRGIRPLLADTRTALTRGGDPKKSIEALTLSGATLIIIDPDTAQRLTLTDAAARVIVQGDDRLIVQAQGIANEMGGRANFALASSANPQDDIGFAARVQGIALSALPKSLQIGALQQATQINMPVSGFVQGRFKDRVGQSRGAGQIALGSGRLFGKAMTSASAAMTWDVPQGRLTLTSVNARGAGVVVGDLNGQVMRAGSNQYRTSFQVRDLDVTDARLGSMTGNAVSGTLAFDSDLRPISGEISGRAFGISRDVQSRIVMQGFSANLAPSGAGNRMAGAFSAQSTTGLLQGKPLQAQGLRVVASGWPGLNGGTANSVTATAQQMSYTLQTTGFSQAFDARGVALGARDVTLASTASPFRATQFDIKAQSVGFPAQAGTAMTGRATNLALEGTGLTGDRGRVVGRVGDFSTSLGEGRNVNIAVIRTGANQGRIETLQADFLALMARGGRLATNGLQLSGDFDAGGLVNANVAAASAELTHAGQLLRPFWAENLKLSGGISRRSADLQTFALRHRGVDITGTTRIALAPRGSPRVDMDAQVDGAFSVETLMSAWPRRFLPETRSAIINLVPEATASVQTLKLAIPAGMVKDEILPRDGIDLRFTLSDTTVQYLKEMSPITHVRGTGVLTGSSLSIDLPEGRIGDIALTQGQVSIPQFKPRNALAQITANVSGDVTQMATEIDQPSLRVFSKAGFDAARLSGTGTASVAIDLPLIKNLTDRDVGLTVRGQFQQAGLVNAFAGLDASDGRVTLEIAERKIDVSGQAWLAGNMFDFTWVNDPTGPEGAQTRLTAKGDVTIDSLRQVGIDIGKYAQGPVGLDLNTTMDGAEIGQARIATNFQNINMALPGNAWTKNEGVAAFGSAQLYAREGGGWNVQDIRFDAPGASLRGAVDLSQSAELLDARFSRVRVDNASDMSVDLTPGPNGLTIAMRGAFLNLAPYLGTKNVSEKAVDLLDRPLMLSADLERVTTGPGRELTGVHADIVRDQTGWRTLEAAGRSDRGPTQISLRAQTDGRRSITGIFSDAGFFAQLLYPGAPIFGGSGTIDGELPVVGANSSGSLSFSGRDIRLERTGASTIVFDRVELPMRVQGGVVTLRDGQADGDAYTVKASGFVDVGAGRLDLRGVATPGGLNRVLSDIPLFGGILGGGQDEGLLGLTFTAKGAMGAPKIRTNPISALAPGFLRKLFESEAPLSPQPRFVAVPFTGEPIVEKWPYGPTEDMSERITPSGQASGPAQ